MPMAEFFYVFLANSFELYQRKLSGMKFTIYIWTAIFSKND